ncbi:SusE domain-containing protein [Paraflavitalea sp. CAU 1676]|uniref:SusE domain-containing protein n=1 Tax=Paraflavitalea sp. CAU 1676 TaxID=3032598 RepID=UPI0023DBF310|nr:SusE domain-containing protein [Paraflavitalea sp. CAU 1676]MDF2186915.1 SusE domain-containing protein [Paraflavitalea sp. CAU 1676]
MKKILLLALWTIAVLAACQKPDYDTTVTGESIGNFALSLPATNAAIALNAATPTAKLEITWAAAKPGVDKVPTYKWVAAAKTNGTLETPLLELPSDNGGKDAKLTITHKQLDDALKAKGIADGAKTELIWSIQADNGSTQQTATETRNITITRMKDGATAFILLGPASSSSPITINPVSTADSVKFNWRRSVPAAGAGAITYKVVFSKDGNFEAPVFTIPAGNTGKDSVLAIVAKDLNDTLVKYNYADLSQTVSLKWTVIATSGTWKQPADYVNEVAFLREINFYLVGSVNDWSIDNPLKMVVDQKADRYGTVFYTYIKLSDNAEFKFFKTKGDWSSGYGDNGAGATAGSFKTAYNVGGNIKVATGGIYRLTIDTKNNLAYVQPKQVGVVGGMQGWDAKAPVYGTYMQRDKFLILASSSGTDQFKFHDGSLGAVWTFGIGDDRWWGLATNGKLGHEGAPEPTEVNIVAPYAPVTRLIWDGSNPQQIGYKAYQGKLRIVGSTAQVGSWTPGNALDMDYQGNGVWKKTVTFAGATEFKFVIAEGWDLNYGVDVPEASGTPGTLKEGGGNITLGAGTYTITIDEYKRTYTIL